jgi:hypothetical protein
VIRARTAKNSVINPKNSSIYPKSKTDSQDLPAILFDVVGGIVEEFGGSGEVSGNVAKVS